MEPQESNNKIHLSRFDLGCFAHCEGMRQTSECNDWIYLSICGSH